MHIKLNILIISLVTLILRPSDLIPIVAKNSDAVVIRVPRLSVAVGEGQRLHIYRIVPGLVGRSRQLKTWEPVGWSQSETSF